MNISRRRRGDQQEAELQRLRRRVEELEAAALPAQDLERQLQAGHNEGLLLQRRLQQSDGQLLHYRELFDFAPIPCLVLDRNGTIESLNLIAASLLQRPRRSLEGVPLILFAARESHQCLLDHLRCSRTGDAIVHSEIILHPSGADPTPVEIHSHRRAGDSDRLLTTLVDLSDRHIAEEERRRAAAAEAASSAKDRFLATVSHELRTPLTPIVNVLEVIKLRNDLPQEYQPLLKMIERNLWLEVRLVDDLLDTSRVVSGKLRLNPEELDLHAVLVELQEMLAEEFRRAGVQLTLALQASRTRLHADPTRIRQVFWNLLRNAVKFTPDGGRVTLTTLDPEPGRIRVLVEDTGMGMDPERIEGMFLPFEQVHSAEQGGLGLGLAIAKGVVAAHGGTIRAHSPGPGRGSIFMVDLPLAD